MVHEARDAPFSLRIQIPEQKHTRPSAKLCRRRILTWILEAPNDTKEITPFSIHVNRGSDRAPFLGLTGTERA